MADASKTGAWRNYRPSKGAVVWSWIGVSALTMLIGFTWGGWTTASGARSMAEQARVELAATVCLNRFLSAPNAEQQLAKFNETSAWRRDEFITEGGWAKFERIDKPIPEVASLCATKLDDAKIPATREEAANDHETSATTTIQ